MVADSAGGVLDDETLQQIAGETGKTVAQVVLRWHIQHGYIVFPKSTTPGRIQENFELFGFELSGEQVARIDDLDRDEEGRAGPHPDRFAYLPG